MNLVRLTTRWRCPIDGKPDGVYGLRMYAEGADRVAIITERADNPGPAFENVAAEVATVLSAGRPATMRFFLHYPPLPNAPDAVRRVDQYIAVRFVSGDARLTRATFAHTTAEEVQALIGQPLVWFPVAAAFARALASAGELAADGETAGFFVRREAHPEALDAAIEHVAASDSTPASLHEHLERYQAALRAAGFDAWIGGGATYLRARWLPNTRVPGRFSDPDEERAFHALRYELALERRDAAARPFADVETINEVRELADTDPVLAASIAAIDERLDDELPVQAEARAQSRLLLRQALERARRNSGASAV